MSSRERKHAEALELARAAGWRSPGEVHDSALERIVDLESRLAVMVKQVAAWRAATGCTVPGEAKLEREQLEAKLKTRGKRT